MKRIVCLGGGPAGLYAAILFKKALPDAKVEVYERNRPDDTFGWGVVFSDQTMEGFRAADAPTHDAIVASFHHWDDIDVHFARAARSRAAATASAASSRKRLLQYLAGARGRARRASSSFSTRSDAMRRRSPTPISSSPPTASTAQRARVTRRCSSPTSTCASAASSGSAPPDISPRSPSRSSAPSTAGFRSTPTSSAAISPRSSSRRARRPGRRTAWTGSSTEESIAFCERLFGALSRRPRAQSNARHLRGSAWLNFNRVLCKRWHHGKRRADRRCGPHGAFLHRLGHQARHGGCDIAGRGTSTAGARRSSAALGAYHAERNLEVLKLQSAARNRMEWFENVARYTHLPPGAVRLQPAHGQSAHRSRESARLRDPRVRGATTRRWLARRSGARASARPPMFLPLHAALAWHLANRVVVSPMAQYCGDGRRAGRLAPRALRPRAARRRRPRRTRR